MQARIGGLNHSRRLVASLFVTVLVGCSPGKQDADGVGRSEGSGEGTHVPADANAGPAPGERATLTTVLMAFRDLEIRTASAGQISSIEVRVGQRVASGAVLARLDDREARALLEQSEAELVRADDAHLRARRLHAQQMISEEDLSAANAGQKVASARRDLAALKLEHSLVMAPVSGTIVISRVQLGQRVQEDEALFRLIDDSRLRADVFIPESSANLLKQGQKVEVVPRYGGPKSLAIVSHASRFVDPASGTCRIALELDNRTGLLRAGSSAFVLLPHMSGDSLP